MRRRKYLHTGANRYGTEEMEMVVRRRNPVLIWIDVDDFGREQVAVY